MDWMDYSGIDIRNDGLFKNNWISLEISHCESWEQNAIVAHNQSNFISFTK